MILLCDPGCAKPMPCSTDWVRNVLKHCASTVSVPHTGVNDVLFLIDLGLIFIALGFALILLVLLPRTRKKLTELKLELFTSELSGIQSSKLTGVMATQEAHTL